MRTRAFRRRVQLVGLTLGFVVLICFLGHRLLSPSAEQAYREFCSSDGVAEDELMDPLILSGEKVVPLVLGGIEDRNMPRRRYAIHFLGNGGYPQALPMLERIAKDKTEDGLFRADAVQAVYMIQEPRGREIAETHRDDQGFLGYISRMLLDGDKELLARRSYIDAFFHRHD